MNFKLTNDITFYAVLGGRLALLFFLLGAAYLFPDTFKTLSENPLKPALLFSGAFGLTIISAWFKEKRLPPSFLPWLQIIGDIILIYFSVRWTGGCASPFVFFFPLAIFTACILSGRKGGTVSALLSTLAFLLICFQEFRKGTSASYITFSFFTNMAAFNVTALIGTALAKRLTKTEKKLAETQKSLDRIENIQRFIADSMDSGLITTDVKGNIIQWNKAATEILGKNEPQYLGRPLRYIWPDGALLMKQIAQEQNNQSRYTTKYRAQNGQEKILSISNFSVRDNKKKLIGHGLIFQDITAIKQQEALLERMRRLAALGEMGAGLAHEIKNPLASLSGAAQLLKEQQAMSSHASKLLDIIVRESGRLNKLTESFLMYARPKARRRAKINIEEILTKVIEVLKQHPDLPNFEIGININHTGAILADPEQFHQVLWNLILNAAQALPEYGGKIKIYTEDKKDKVLLVVEDNGKGIEPEALKKIFNPFFTTNPNGHGLGMSVVHRIIETCNGTISIESTPNKGTKVIIEIPKSPPNSSG